MTKYTLVSKCVARTKSLETPNVYNCFYRRLITIGMCFLACTCIDFSWIDPLVWEWDNTDNKSEFQCISGKAYSIELDDVTCSWMTRLTQIQEPVFLIAVIEIQRKNVQNTRYIKWTLENYLFRIFRMLLFEMKYVKWSTLYIYYNKNKSLVY